MGVLGLDFAPPHPGFIAPGPISSRPGFPWREGSLCCVASHTPRTPT
ncbi:hypothetical protein [Lysobacter gummosus]